MDIPFLHKAPADTPIRRYADTPIRRYADTPIRRYADTPIRRYADTPVAPVAPGTSSPSPSLLATSMQCDHSPVNAKLRCSSTGILLLGEAVNRRSAWITAFL